MLTKIKTLRPTYAYIDLDNFLHNLQIAKKLSGSGEVIAIVKADAYGHGVEKIAKCAYYKGGIRIFGVATVEEGIKLREHLKEAKIIVLGYIDSEHFSEVVEYNLIPTVFDYEYAASLNDFLKSKNLIWDICYKLDTGMNRLGFSTEFDFHIFKENFRYLHVFIFMTHLSSADTDNEYTELQLKKFDEYLMKYGVNCKTSVFNSSALCKFRNIYDYSRPGIMLYGFVYPTSMDITLKPVMKIFSRIIHIKDLKKGEKVSYNQKFTATKNMRIGVLPIGYADGYFRLLSNKGYVYINGKRCNIVGTVCMDMVMIDVSHLNENELMMEVEVLGEHVRADELANLCGTISYEILCSISNRIPRVYSDD